MKLRAVGYMEALEELPVHVVEAAVARWLRGDVPERSNVNFPPPPGVLAQMARREKYQFEDVLVSRVRDELALPEPNEETRLKVGGLIAELQAKLGPKRPEPTREERERLDALPAERSEAEARMWDSLKAYDVIIQTAMLEAGVIEAATVAEMENEGASEQILADWVLAQKSEGGE